MLTDEQKEKLKAKYKTPEDLEVAAENALVRELEADEEERRRTEEEANDPIKRAVRRIMAERTETDEPETESSTLAEPEPEQHWTDQVLHRLFGDDEEEEGA